MAPQASQPWQRVLQLGQLDLRPRLAAAGALIEDLENEGAAIHDLHAQ
jgi:hypothetical protein